MRTVSKMQYENALEVVKKYEAESAVIRNAISKIKITDDINLLDVVSVRAKNVLKSAYIDAIYPDLSWQIRLEMQRNWTANLFISDVLELIYDDKNFLLKCRNCGLRTNDEIMSYIKKYI